MISNTQIARPPHAESGFIARGAAFCEQLLRQCGRDMLQARRDIDETQGGWAGEQYKHPCDALAHEFLCQRIHETFPDIPVVSEEDPNSVTSRFERYFIIDPIDGTASFAQGFPGWVTQIAYVAEGIPLFAGIYVPATNEYFEAVHTRGAWRNKQPLQAAGSCSLGTIIDNYPEPRGIAAEAFVDLGMHSYIESGSIALKICRVADNTANLFLKLMSPRDWDIAAPMLVLEEAGGVISDAHGKRYLLGAGERRHDGLIATNSNANLQRVTCWLESRK